MSEHAHHQHEGHDQPTGRELTRMAAMATSHCLAGCSIGEVLGMVLSTWWGWGNVGSIVLSIVLAFVFGYSLTILGLARQGIGLRDASRLALASDSVSIATMEVVDNVVELLVPGAMSAALSTWLFWWSLALSLAIAFVAALPVNRLLIAKGRGHAVVHAAHSGAAAH